MNIEVTVQTFAKIFTKKDFQNYENFELFNKQLYFNKELDQKGQIIENYISGTKQFYLTDINA